MKLKMIDWEQKLAEIPQQLNTRFALAHKEGNGVYSNTMPFIKCRDFFGDVLEAVQTNSPRGIYGFNFDPAQQPFDTDKCRMLVKFVSEESKQAFIKNHNHYKEELKKLTGGLGYGTVKDIEADQPTVLVIANPLYQQSVVGISWFTFVLKTLSWDTLDTTKDFVSACLALPQCNESSYMKAVQNNINTFLINFKKLTSGLQYVHGYDQPQGINVVHNSAGFKSVLFSYLGTIGKQLQELQNELVAK